MVLPSHLRNKIVAAIQEVGASVVSERSGIALPSISRITTGRQKDINTETLDKLARAVGLQLDLVEKQNKK